MATHQSKIAIADGGPVMTTSRRPPMTSKQAKKAFAKANNIPKMSWKERKRMEAAELAAQKREFEREKAQAKARAVKAKKDGKEEAERAERKKAGIPEKSRWVRPSQGRITGFLGLGKRGRGKDVEEEEEWGRDESDDDGEEPVPKRFAMDGAEDDTDEEDIEEREADISEAQFDASAIKTLCDTKEGEEDAQQEDRPRPLEYAPVVRAEKENSPEAQLEAEILQDQEEPELELKRELVVQSEPEAQPQLEDQPEPELQLDQEDSLGPEVQARPEVQADPAAQEEQEVQASPKVQAEPTAHEDQEVQTESQEHPVPKLDDPKLPSNTQYFTSSQDFLDDDDIFLELAAAHQLLSESFDAGERSLAAAQSLPALETKEAPEKAQANITKTTVVYSPQHDPCPVIATNPTAFPTSPPKRQLASPVLQRTPRPRIEFDCSGVSLELTSSNPFSQNQTALRLMSKPVPKPNTAAVASVMFVPTSIIRLPRSTMLSTPIRSQGKNMPAPSTNNPLSQRTVQGIGAAGSSHRLPLNDISKHARNASAKALPSSFTRSKPFLKPSLLPSHAGPKVSPFNLPTSTQLFLADHLDDFFPSPSQELRELLEDIEDDDIPSNTQVAREIGRDSVVARPILMEPAQPMLGDDFPWMSSRELMFSSQELRELESPSKISPVPAPPPTPWDVRRARKPRFFVEKEEDLFAAAIHESKLQGKVDDEAAKLRLENMRIERELLCTRQPSQRHTPSARRASQDAARLEVGADDVSVQLESLNASQLTKLMDGIESDEYSDDFDDEEAEASMIAFGHKLETPFARDYETETESETESEKHESFIQRCLDDDANAVANAEDAYAFM
ncbi:hypothetical protein VC83_01340 [Pseudogymnoascus destructans]|uniref:Uncharacterized protein n=2 Tax=Pseudogymnoascus destructans TaxID=655981 RepID=L8G270_PSED2|nr:uncharacterized protein VC83_01340 [Pseudogymnoascus destructans]ELR07207.1 hypothetical protein GMDG_02434 [Pseudogymnoascus destructans 20631-21]OAF61812.1 hypothetical protein VC83_01340 [Pseudogymnoascus destructans]